MNGDGYVKKSKPALSECHCLAGLGVRQGLIPALTSPALGIMRGCFILVLGVSSRSVSDRSLLPATEMQLAVRTWEAAREMAVLASAYLPVMRAIACVPSMRNHELFPRAVCDSPCPSTSTDFTPAGGTIHFCWGGRQWQLFRQVLLQVVHWLVS